jgi:hypothetical protein
MSYSKSRRSEMVAPHMSGATCCTMSTLGASPGLMALRLTIASPYLGHTKATHEMTTRIEGFTK